VGDCLWVFQVDHVIPFFGFCCAPKNFTIRTPRYVD
jgi:hypothetical protein